MASDLSTRLRELHAFTAQTPLFNPVFQLGLDLSRDLEGGKKSLKDIASYAVSYTHLDVYKRQQ